MRRHCSAGGDTFTASSSLFRTLSPRSGGSLLHGDDQSQFVAAAGHPILPDLSVRDRRVRRRASSVLLHGADERDGGNNTPAHRGATHHDRQRTATLCLRAHRGDGMWTRSRRARGMLDDSTPGPPPRLRSQQAAPPTAKSPPRRFYGPRAATVWGTRWPPTSFLSRLAARGGVLGRSAAIAAHAPCVLPRHGDPSPGKRSADLFCRRLLALCQTLKRSRNSAARSGVPVTSRLAGDLSGLSALTQAAWVPLMRASALGVSRRSMRARPFSRTNV